MRFLSTLLFVCVLAGCGESVTSGRVIDKYHEEASSFVTFVPISTGQVCSGTGTTRTCTPTYISVPFWHHDDEDWVIRIENDEGKRGTVYVSEDRYLEIAIGSWFELGEGDATRDPAKRGKRA